MTADLNALFHEYEDWIRRMAKRLRAQFPSVALEDLQQAGAQGFVKGMGRYEDDGTVRDPARHRKAFLHKWVKGAMLMHVRQDAALHRIERETRDALQAKADPRGAMDHEPFGDGDSVSAAAWSSGLLDITESLAIGTYTRRTPEDEMLQQETLATIDMFFAELDEREREFVRLRFFEELTLEEIGLAFGYSPDSACSAMSRMEKRIRTQARRITSR